MAIEQPKYSVELSEKPFEVRAYAPIVFATVHVNGDRSDAVSAGFRILANYIFGNNESKEKIAMTAPVTQNAGQRIAMTGPVQQTAIASGWDVSFAMPSDYTLGTLPKPRDTHISLVQTPGMRMAAITFSGFWSDASFQSHQEQLLAFLKKHQLIATSIPLYAYYNPPWTPWFLRTNEVLIQIRNGNQSSPPSK